MRAEGAVLVSAVRANFSTIFIFLNATVGGNVSVHSTILDLASSSTQVTISTPSAGGLYDNVPRGSHRQQPWAALLYSKARGPPTAEELELALTPLPAGDLNLWGSRAAAPAPPPPLGPAPPGPLGPLPPCVAIPGCVGCGGCKWPFLNATLPEPKSIHGQLAQCDSAGLRGTLWRWQDGVAALGSRERTWRRRAFSTRRDSYPVPSRTAGWMFRGIRGQCRRRDAQEPSACELSCVQEEEPCLVQNLCWCRIVCVILSIHTRG